MNIKNDKMCLLYLEYPMRKQLSEYYKIIILLFLLT